ncbi:unnamed protein product, partial [Callosobruchus maculatus]
IAASQEELVALLSILEQHSGAYDLGINYNETKVMIADREHGNHREIKSVRRYEVVQSFVYLGSLIDNSEIAVKMRFGGAFKRHVWP